MPTISHTYRYQLPKKAIKADCPDCSPKYRKTLSRYIDTKTGEPLPESYGRCDRESNCGYHVSPYQKTAGGLSYANEQKPSSQGVEPIPKTWFRLAREQKHNHIHRRNVVQYLMERQGATLEQAEQVVKYVFNKPALPTQPTTPYIIPDEIFKPSLGHYDENKFAQLLSRQFGPVKANALLQQFQIGTSRRWPGACVFWLKDQKQRVRAGQVVLFADDWHKAGYTNQQGEVKICISSVSDGLLRSYRRQQQPAPSWLMDYHKNAPRWPVLFGLHQLASAPADQPVAVVEAPKTAIICSALIPDFVWLAAGALSYLNAERLAPLLGHAVMLFPDLSKEGKAFTRWSKVADELNAKGHQISISTLLEDNASEKERIGGLDLADFLLKPTPIVTTVAGQSANRNSIFKPSELQLERLAVKSQDSYPTDWDIPTPLVKEPTISAESFHKWQCQDYYFSQMGLASLLLPAQPLD